MRKSSERHDESILFPLTTLPEIPPYDRCNALVSGKLRSPIAGECGVLAGDSRRFRLLFSALCAGFSTIFRRKYQGAGTKSAALAGLKIDFY